MAWGQTQLTACELRKIFTFLNGKEKNQKESNIPWHVKIVLNSILVSKDNILLCYTKPIHLLLNRAALGLPWELSW